MEPTETLGTVTQCQRILIQSAALRHSIFELPRESKIHENQRKIKEFLVYVTQPLEILKTMLSKLDNQPSKVR